MTPLVRTMSRAFCWLAALTALGCGGSTSTAAPPGVTLQVSLKSAHYRLPNGLEVVLHQDRSLRNVVVNVRYHVGSKDDPQGRSGFAHLYEHLMFLGSKKVDEAGFTHALENVGVLSYNAGTTQDWTDYHEVIPPAALPVALWLEADRMGSPLERLNDASFKRERDVVKNEWRQHYDNEPFGHVRSFARGATFPEGHPYHSPTIGVPEDLDRASIEDAGAFGARFYIPSNATLVVVGDIDVEETKNLVERFFAAIPSGEAITPRAFPFPQLTSDRHVSVEADVERSRIVVAWPVPRPYGRGWEDVQFAASRLTGMTAHKLGTQGKVARNIRWDLVPGRLGSLLTITMDLEAGETPDTALAALDRRIDWLTRSELREAAWSDLADSRTRRMADTVLELSSLTARAERLQDYTEYFGEPDSAQTDLRRIQAVRADGAIDEAKAFLGGPKVIVTVTPTKSAPRSGRVVR